MPDTYEVHQYRAWAEEVDEILEDRFGTVAADLPDACWHDYFDDSLTPGEAVEAAIEDGAFN